MPASQAATWPMAAGGPNGGSSCAVASISRRTSSPARGRASAAARSRTGRSRSVRIEPTAGEDTEQHRHDDDPAEHADLREAARHRGRPRAASAALAFAARDASPCYQRVRRRSSSGVGASCEHSPRRAPRSGRRWRMIWRIAFSCSRVLSTCSVRSVSISARKRRSTRRRASRDRRLAPPRGLRRRLAGPGDGQHAAPHRAVVSGAVGRSPSSDRNRQAGEEVRVTRQDAEAAAVVFGAQRTARRLRQRRRPAAWRCAASCGGSGLRGALPSAAVLPAALPPELPTM